MNCSASHSPLLQNSGPETVAQLSKGIAHAFNNILTGVIGYIALAQEDAMLNGDQHVAKRLERALEGCRLAGRTLQQLLMYSPGPVIQALPIDLHAWARDWLRSANGVLLSNLDVRLEHDGSAPTVSADATGLGTAITNLLLNAREAIAGHAPGKVVIRVSTTTLAQRICTSCGRRLAGSYACVSVSDDGAGMDEATIANAFVPFFSTRGSGVARGLGLAVVHGIVHALGGHVLLTSGPGQGTECQIVLPLRPGPGD